jgi:hypothetical protein
VGLGIITATTTAATAAAVINIDYSQCRKCLNLNV